MATMTVRYQSYPPTRHTNPLGGSSNLQRPSDHFVRNLQQVVKTTRSGHLGIVLSYLSFSGNYWPRAKVIYAFCCPMP